VPHNNGLRTYPAPDPDNAGVGINDLANGNFK